MNGAVAPRACGALSVSLLALLVRRMIPSALLVLVLLGRTAAASGQLRDGDIVFQSSRSGQSLAVQLATHSPYSHVGIVFMRDGKPFVYEAVATVRYTPLEEWRKHGDGGRYVVKRLKTPLDAAQVEKLREAASPFEGKPYDLYFEWTGERIYCSELVWKMYDQALGVRLGELQKLREFDLGNDVVRAKIRERYGANVPLDEPVISPARLFAAPLLIEVEQKK
jgi:integrase